MFDGMTTPARPSRPDVLQLPTSIQLLRHKVRTRRVLADPFQLKRGIRKSGNSKMMVNASRIAHLNKSHGRETEAGLGEGKYDSANWNSL